jgi:hypothetical protein
MLMKTSISFFQLGTIYRCMAILLGLFYVLQTHAGELSQSNHLVKVNIINNATIRVIDNTYSDETTTLCYRIPGKPQQIRPTQ